MRVLDWIIKRVEGEVDAVETPIGFLPKAEDINLKGIEDEVSPSALQKLLTIDKEEWKKEIAEMRRYYDEDIRLRAETFLRLSTMSSTLSRLTSISNFIPNIKLPPRFRGGFLLVYTGEFSR